MPLVKNVSHDDLDVPMWSIAFPAGETVEVSDEQADTLVDRVTGREHPYLKIVSDAPAPAVEDKSAESADKE